MVLFDLRLFATSQSRIVLSAEEERKREKFLGVPGYGGECRDVTAACAN